MKGPITIICLLLCCLPNISFAEGMFTPSATDKSVEYLGLIFGQVGTLAIGGGDDLVSVLMKLINSIVLSLGFLIIGWTVFVSSLHSAHEGEVMGKKWSSIWVPLRGAIGMYLLLPTTSGYSYIQVAVMWVILQSIGAADQLWNQMIDSWARSGAINQTASSSVTLDKLDDNDLTLGKAILKAKICELIINNNSISNAISGRINFYQEGNKAFWGTPEIGPICGSIDLQPIIKAVDTKIAEDKPRLLKAYFYALDNLQNGLQSAANESVEAAPDEWANYIEVKNASFNLTMNMSNILQPFLYKKTKDAKKEQTVALAKNTGWIHAGGFYFNLVQGESSISKITFTRPTVMAADLCASPQTADYCTQLKTEISEKYNAYIDSLNDQKNTTETTPYNLSNIPPTSQKTISAMSVPIKKTIMNFIKDISGDKDKTDPLLKMSRIGQGMMLGSEIIIWVLLTAVSILTVVTAILKSLQPAGFYVMALINTLLVGLLILVFMLWGAGATLGLYLPLIPYILFLFGGLAWMMLVIETMISSPLIALTLIVPSEEEIGKATQALLIILGIFFRPALMIIGFIFAIKLLTVAIGMLNYGFENILTSTISGLGLFGSVAIVIAYVGLLTVIVHESFSLIYVLPEKALRWMGVQGEGLDIGSHLKKVESSVDSASKIGGGVAKGVASGAMKAAKKDSD